MQRLLLFLLLVFLIAAVLRVDFYFTIAYLFFGVYLLARLWVKRGLKNLKTERRFIDRAFHGDTVPVRLNVRNTGRLPITGNNGQPPSADQPADLQMEAAIHLLKGKI